MHLPPEANPGHTYDDRVSGADPLTVPLERLKWPIRKAREIDAPVDTVWKVIATPGNLELCHPFCDSNPVEVWPGADSRDEIRYLNGKVYRRRFRNWFDGLGYDLEIIEEGRRIAYVEWRVEPITRTTSGLSITVFPSVLEHLPNPVRWLSHVVFLRPMLLSYLNPVVRGFDWYITRGEPVPRNRFGSHRWFSA